MMHHYPPLAAHLVSEMLAQAARDPERTIAFQGAPGAYSHLAIREIDPDAYALPCFSFDDAFDAVCSGKAFRAVIPIENSVHGRVADVHFLLPESGLFIVAEHFLRVRHCLLALAGTKLEGIRQALSHPQALGQCRQRLKALGIAPVSYPDTAAAAAFIQTQGDPATAAIASHLAAELYGLECIAEGIEDKSHNTTRFVVLSRQALDYATVVEPAMTSLTFQVRSVPAALFKALGGFATNGVNITKLESYQPEGSFTAAAFYVEIEGMPTHQNVAFALEELRFYSHQVDILGCYPRTHKRVSPGAQAV